MKNLIHKILFTNRITYGGYRTTNYGRTIHYYEGRVYGKYLICFVRFRIKWLNIFPVKEKGELTSIYHNKINNTYEPRKSKN